MEKVLFRTDVMPCKRSRTRKRGCSLAITKMTEQKLMGIVLLLICAVVLWLCYTIAILKNNNRVGLTRVVKQG